MEQTRKNYPPNSRLTKIVVNTFIRHNSPQLIRNTTNIISDFVSYSRSQFAILIVEGKKKGAATSRAFLVAPRPRGPSGNMASRVA